MECINKLDKIWRSILQDQLKINLFTSTVEPILAYGQEAWALNSRLHQRLDGCYTNLFRRVQNLSWKSHPTLERIYGKLTKVSSPLRQRRTRFAGHCFRAKDEVGVIRSTSHIYFSAASDSRKLMYPDMITCDTGVDQNDLPTMMADKNCWREVVLT